MPTKTCDVCGEHIYINQKEMRYLHSDLDIFCSKICIINRITSFKDSNNNGNHFKKYRNRVDLLNFSPGHIWSAELNIGFRSTYELKVASFFKQCGLDFLYEPYFFVIDGKKTYSPDFFIPKYDVFIEVKGFWGMGKKKKMSQFIQEYPHVNIIGIPWILRKEFK